METSKIVNETISAKHESASVTVRITDGAVVGARLGWYNAGAPRWESCSLGNATQLRGMQTALGEVLAELQERGLVPPEPDSESG